MILFLLSSLFPEHNYHQELWETNNSEIQNEKFPNYSLNCSTGRRRTNNFSKNNNQKIVFQEKRTSNRNTKKTNINGLESKARRIIRTLIQDVLNYDTILVNWLAGWPNTDRIIS